ncbi:3-carboxyethylcatechol 2,3-dioxygenase [Microbaculum sp. FT89]|uniref:3-carboxyethylcatechol 2,3-dioxygenase n=1 Tax=Microbaculum sp. FT89 TaxID=3447298 RepID=UPI003F52FA71
MIVGSVCMSHSPLLERNRADPGIEQRFNAAIAAAADYVADLAPDLTIVIHPDHINGFFYDLLPAFCVGIQATSIGDFGTAAGKLSIPEDTAMDLSRSILDDGIDTAISYKMEVDHGAVQPVEILSAKHDLSNLIPVFINCAAAPRPTFDRVRALGRAVGAWAQRRPERILIIGSGGLSHDPPMPALAGAAPEVRNRLINGGELTHAQRVARQSKAVQESEKVLAGTSKTLPLDPAWDRKLLDGFLSGDLTTLDASSDEEITATGGRGGHEVRSWFATLAALGPNYEAEELFYEPMNVWLTGMGVLKADPA